MKYILLIHSGDAMGAYEELAEEEQRSVLGEYLALAQMPNVSESHQLQPVDTATTVRVNGSETLTTDGPFAEAKEALGGYYVVDAADVDAAIAVAAQIPAARMGGAIEVRPLVER